MSAEPVVGIQTGGFVLLDMVALGFLTMQLPAKGLKLFGSGRGYEVAASVCSGCSRAPPPPSSAGDRALAGCCSRKS